VLRIYWEKINGFPFSSAVFLETVSIDKFLFHRGIVQPGVEHILGEFTVVLKSISSLSIAEGLIEAFGVVSQFDSTLGQLEAILMPLKSLLIAC